MLGQCCATEPHPQPPALRDCRQMEDSPSDLITAFKGLVFRYLLFLRCRGYGFQHVNFFGSVRGCNSAHNSLATNENCYFFNFRVNNFFLFYTLAMLSMYVMYFGQFHTAWSLSSPSFTQQVLSYFLPCSLFCCVLFSVCDPLRLIGTAHRSMDGLFTRSHNLPVVAAAGRALDSLLYPRWNSDCLPYILSPVHHESFVFCFFQC